MRTYREQCPFKSTENTTIIFSISSISPPDARNDSSIRKNFVILINFKYGLIFMVRLFNNFRLSTVELNKCNFNGFPKIGGIVLIVISMLVLMGEIYPTYQRFYWEYKPLRVPPRTPVNKMKWTNDSRWVTIKNTTNIILLTVNVLPISKMLIVLLVWFTSPPVFGQFPVSDSTHFSLVAVRWSQH